MSRHDKTSRPFIYKQTDSGLYILETGWGSERGKDAQGTIKILLDTDFTSYLAHFLHNIVGAQLNIRGAQALPKRY